MTFLAWVSLAAALAGPAVPAEDGPVARLPGDPLPPAALSRLGTRRLRHDAPVTLLASSPDGSRILSGSIDRTVQFWESHEGRSISAPLVLDEGIISGSLSRDGSRLAVGTQAHTALLLDPMTGGILQLLPDAGGTVALSPDGTRLATAGVDSRLSVTDADTGELLHAGDGIEFTPQFMSFDSSGQWILVLEFNRAKHLRRGGRRDNDPAAKLSIWSAESGEKLKMIPFLDVSPRQFAMAPGAPLIAVPDGLGCLDILNIETGETVRHIETGSDAIHCLAFSPDGGTLASAESGGRIVFRDVASGKTSGSFHLTGNQPHMLAFLDGGARLAIATESTITVHAVPSGDPDPDLPRHDAPVGALSYSPDGRLLASGSNDRTVRIWEPASERCLVLARGHEGPVTDVVFVPGTGLLASASLDGTIRFRDVATGEQSFQFEDPESAVVSIDVSPDGRWLVAASGLGSVGLWSIEERKLVWSREPELGTQFVTRFSPDGSVFAAAGSDIRLFRTDTREESRHIEGLGSPTGALAFSPDGTTLAAGLFDRSVRVWDLASGAVVHDLREHFSRVKDVAFSPSGRQLASVGSSDPLVRLWDLESGQLVRTFEGHVGDVLALAFAPDGKTLASGGNDTTILTWAAGDP